MWYQFFLDLLAPSWTATCISHLHICNGQGPRPPVSTLAHPLGLFCTQQERVLFSPQFDPVPPLLRAFPGLPSLQNKSKNPYFLDTSPLDSRMSHPDLFHVSA